jgi:hypothetical protein
MNAVANSPESAFLVKCISYLACDGTDTFIPSCASRASVADPQLQQKRS